MWIAVPVHTVHTVIDGNKVDAVLWKQHFRIHSDLQIVTPEPAHILNDNALDLARLDVGKHPLESGPVEVGSRISVVLVVVADGGIAVFPAILFQNPLLRLNLSRAFSPWCSLILNALTYWDCNSFFNVKLQEDHNGADCHCDPLCFTFDLISEIPCGNPP